MTAAEQRKRRMCKARIGRFAIQLVFFILAPAFFVGAFNGVKYLAEQLGAGAPFAATSFLIMLVAVLLFTILFGRFFCGFACAFGTLGDVVFALRDALWRKAGLPEVCLPERAVRILSFVKFAILAAICVMCVLGVWGAASNASPWVSFAALCAGSLEGIAAAAAITLLLVVVLMAVRERAFCQFLCPLGALFALMPVIPLARFKRMPARCIPKCGRCKAACPVSIWPDEGTREGECIACARCEAVCPIGNVSELPQPDGPTLKRRVWPLAWPLGKAVLLLALFWMLGAVRYLPAPPEFLDANALVTGALSGTDAEEDAASSVQAASGTSGADGAVGDASAEAPALKTRELPEEKGGAATFELTMPQAALEGRLKDGTYTGSALCGLGNDEDWAPYYVIVQIQVEDGKVARILDISGDEEGAVDAQYVYDSAENSLYLSRAIKGTGGRFSKGAQDQIEAFIESGDATGGVDTVSGSTFSVLSIVQAYNKAVAEAVAQAEG